MSHQKSCLQCNQLFDVTDHHEQFLERAAPRVGERTLSYCSPRFCYLCREQHRLAWRNDRSLYPRSCMQCKKRVISCYSEASGIKVYCNTCWNSDAWDPLSYGRTFNPHRPFLDQFSELLREIPHLALYNIGPENSEYCNHAERMKDSYLVFASGNNEKVMYAARTWQNLNCIDVVESFECQHSYSLLGCHHCYNLQASVHSSYCSDSYYLFDCHSCKSCFGSANLRQAQYVWFNKQLTKSEYEAKLGEYKLGSYRFRQSVAERFTRHLSEQPRRCALLTGCEDCTGDQLSRCKECTYCFNLSESRDCHHCELGYQASDSYDASGIAVGELCTGIVNHLGSNRNCSTVVTYYNNDCYYSYHNQSCQDVIGAVGLRHKQYVILNRQYPREEYQQILTQIAEQMRSAGIWGEFFPGAISPFGYNETEAFSIYPITEKQASTLGFRWSNYVAPPPSARVTTAAHELVDTISEVSDELLETAIECERSKKLFKIMRSELQFYRDNSIPLPRRHPDERYRDLLAARTSRQLYLRACSNCSRSITSSYQPGVKLTVLCEECYHRVIAAA